MKTPKLLIVAATLFTSASLALAQTEGQQSNQNNTETQSGDDEVQSVNDARNFFQVSLSNGGSYMVALSRITSIAKHEYIVDGTVRVNEVSISAEGSTITRFYFLEPVSEKSPSAVGQAIIDRTKSSVKKVTQRTGTEDVLTAVAKSYPQGTHMHNVEYRLKTKANVGQLYSSLEDAWYRGQGKKVSIRTKK